MIDIAMADLRGRVLVSRERVKFADADPYAHLQSGAYVDMIMSHRVEVLHDLIGFSIMDYTRSGIAFPARNIAVEFLRPAFVGDLLEVASWIEELGKSGFEVRVIISGVNDRAARVVASMHFVTVDVRTGKSLPIPETLPSTATANPLITLPTSDEYRRTIAGLPDDWVDPDAQ